jgi:hypothetical protein
VTADREPGLAPVLMLRQAKSAGPRWPMVAAVALLALIVVFVILDAVVTSRTKAQYKVRTTAASVKTLQTIASTGRRGRPDTACPTPEGLLEAHQIDAASKLTDAWDMPFIIVCDADATTASSAGPDRIAGTTDDIRFPLVAGEARARAPAR